MKIVISPAKTLNYESALPFTTASTPAFLKEARQIRKVLKEKSPAELMALMEISDKLAELNWQRNQSKSFGAKELGSHARQAVYAFNGDVYVGLDAYTLSEEQLRVAQEKLRILSGLYGILKPMDIIEPYRLEMGTQLQVGDFANLYAFWKEKVTRSLNKELKKGEVLVNLASQEYFGAINAAALKAKVITPEFKEFRNGKLSIISFFAKKARGLMVRFILDQGIENPEDLKKFNYEGYGFDSTLSTASKWVFTR